MHQGLFRFLVTAIVVIGLSSSCLAQKAAPKPSATPQKDPCGDPIEGGMVLGMVFGHVVQILDGQTLIMASKPGDRIKVHLADIAVVPPDQPLGREAKKFLEKLLADKAIAVAVNE